ncbi:phosphoribosylaminoimidazolesuccinocarboxamide synthase [Chromatiales bacterium (ex Bugula neritina AB1)]|nr:phosphoribosylaminoimidazolesuccinocarboxamide synthase [Chromatiales bacterium (ex Bugula neritina AB1)]
MASTTSTTTIRSLPLLHQGKVRDIYAVGEDHLLMIATDRLSAFDVIFPDPLPGKGILLTKMAEFWFQQMHDLVPNHLCHDITLEDILTDRDELRQARDRSMIVNRLTGFPIEAIVRGYLIGSGWKDYQSTGSLCGITLEENLQLAQQFHTPLYTPATKADVGDHDENISYAETESLIGVDHAREVKEISLAIYQRAAEFAGKRGLILADTKFEFGLDKQGRVTLMDEILTPDSSRYWDAASWQPGENPQSYDKQFVRDYLETLDWNKTAPGPGLPADILKKTLQRYQTALEILTA